MSLLQLHLLTLKAAAVEAGGAVTIEQSNQAFREKELKEQAALKRSEKAEKATRKRHEKEVKAQAAEQATELATAKAGVERQVDGKETKILKRNQAQRDANLGVLRKFEGEVASAEAELLALQARLAAVRRQGKLMSAAAVVQQRENKQALMLRTEAHNRILAATSEKEYKLAAARAREAQDSAQGRNLANNIADLKERVHILIPPCEFRK